MQLTKELTYLFKVAHALSSPAVQGDFITNAKNGTFWKRVRFSVVPLYRFTVNGRENTSGQPTEVLVGLFCCWWTVPVKLLEYHTAYIAAQEYMVYALKALIRETYITAQPGRRVLSVGFSF